MPAGLDALLEPVEQILQPSLEHPYPAWLYMKIQGGVGEQEFAIIGRHISANPGLPWAAPAAAASGSAAVKRQGKKTRENAH